MHVHVHVCMAHVVCFQEDTSTYPQIVCICNIKTLKDYMKLFLQGCPIINTCVSLIPCDDTLGQIRFAKIDSPYNTRPGTELPFILYSIQESFLSTYW